ncbi:MAG: hypothetical protein O3A00_19055, partial [Planctomycetota bacterium]|nr:hypothetical protein [Planctomycetota bacterium]
MTQSSTAAAVNEKQDITREVFDGQFTLTFVDASNTSATTTALDRASTPGQVEDALEALSNIGVGNVVVTGTSAAWIVEFQGALADTNFNRMTINPTVSGATAIAKATTLKNGQPDDTSLSGDQSANEQQAITVYAGLVTFNGDDGTDTFNVIDIDDTEDNIARLDSSRISGLDMTLGVAFNDSTLEQLNLEMGSGNDTLNINGNSAAGNNINTGTGNDTVNVQFGLVNDQSAASITSPVNLTDTQGTNSLSITGTSLADTITISATQVSRSNTPDEVVNFTSSFTTITANGGDSADTFNVSPSTTAEITIDGGGPDFGGGSQSRDQLNFDPLGNPAKLEGRTITTDGGSPVRPVTINGFEQVSVASGGNPVAQPANSHFDFGTSSSPLTAGYIRVPVTTYSSSLGYGWTSTTGLEGFDETVPPSGDVSSLTRDGIQGTNHTFQVDLANGEYLVRVVMGRTLHSFDNMQVYNADNSRLLLDDLDTSNSFVVRSALVQVTDGSLNLRFTDSDGADPSSNQTKKQFAVLALEIAPAVFSTIGIPPQPSRVANGVSEDTITGYGATPGSVVSITASSGTIITPDLSSRFEGTQVAANANGEFTFTIRRPFASGDSSLLFEELTTAGRGAAVISYASDPIRYFDFNSGNSPTEAPERSASFVSGVIGVQPSDVFSASRSYGWDTAIGGQKRNFTSRLPMGALRTDYHFSDQDHTFSASVGNQEYRVSLIAGDFQSTRQFVFPIDAENGGHLETLTVPPQTFVVLHFDVEVSDGRLDLRFGDPTAGSQQWLVNGLYMRPVSSVGAINFTALGDKTADGQTVITVSASSSLPAGTPVTVSSSLGTIATDDAITNIAGHQLLVGSGGTISFDLISPTAAGVPTLTATALDGSASGTVTYAATLQFVAAASLRFDFDHTTSSTQTGYLPVLGNQLFASGLGYGWSETVESATRNAFGTEARRRDFHFEHRPRTFSVEVPNGDYIVSVMLGDWDSAAIYDNMQVTVEETAQEVTARDQVFQSLVFDVTVSDGILDVAFDKTGEFENWLVNSLEVRQKSSVTAITFTPNIGERSANGSSTDTIAMASSLAAGTLVTVSSTLGTVTSSDSDPNTAGVQVPVTAGGAIQFTLQRPTSGGTPTLTATTTDGAG